MRCEQGGSAWGEEHGHELGRRAHVHLAERMAKMKSSSTLRVLQITERLKAEGIDVISLGAGEPDFPTPENIKDAAKTAIDAGFTKYTPAGGTADLKRAILERIRRDFGGDYNPEEVIATVGGKQAIFEGIAALIEPGDEVLLPAPYWVSFPEIVHFAGGTPVVVDTESTDFQLTAAMVAIFPDIFARSRKSTPSRVQAFG